MPVRLERVALAFDVIGKGSAFSEWVAALGHKAGLIFLQDSQISEGGRVRRGVLL